jgi:2,3-dihydroxybiphenyl 1,2-dioxygenase
MFSRKGERATPWAAILYRLLPGINRENFRAPASTCGHSEFSPLPGERSCLPNLSRQAYRQCIARQEVFPMAAVTQLGYLGIGVSDTEAWSGYATEMLGLELTSREKDDTLRFRLDGHGYRIAVHGGGNDDIGYVGWQTEDAIALEAIATRLEQAGIAVAPGTAEDLERRRVAGLIRFDDPDGHQTEVFYGPEMAETPFETQKLGGRFVADDQGLGHLVLAVSDLDRTMSFYTGLLGLRVSDYVNTGAPMGFLHCNPRHHSIAFVQLPKVRKRINHFMLQLEDMDDVGRAYDAVLDGKAPLYLTLGKHNNDFMTSFYMANPSSFGVEYGWGAREIDDACWEVERHTTGSFWGHRRPKPPQG